MVKRFNLYKEGSYTTNSDLKIKFMGPADLKYIETKEHTFWGFLNEMKDGSRCIALIKDAGVVSYLWVSNKFIDYYNLKIPLKKNEAMLYFHVTKPEERGKGYAEILRAKVYDILREQGKDTFYSITDLENKPALRFKEKIGAEIVSTYKYVKFWKYEKLIKQ
jgi:RimJ/RimL family protein N-acetyltransferase